MRKHLVKVGDRVHFFSEELGNEDGIVKDIPATGPFVFVVYKCAGEWWKYSEYTAEATHIEDLRPGWQAEKLEDTNPYHPSVLTDTEDEYQERNYGVQDDDHPDNTSYGLVNFDTE